MYIVNISYVKFNNSGMRNEKIFLEMLVSNKVFSGGIFIDPIVTATGFSRRINCLAKFFTMTAVSVAPNALRISPHFFLPFTFRFSCLAKFQAWLLARKIQQYIPEDEPFVLWINNPNYTSYFLSKELERKARKIVFDMADDYLAFDGAESSSTQHKLFDLVANSDALLAVNSMVASKYPHPNSLVFNNCTDFDHFQKSGSSYESSPFFPKPVGRKYVGFIGGLNAGRADLDLLDKLFSSIVDAVFLFVGYTNSSEITDFIEKSENAFFVPFVDYEVLPSVVKSFDVAIVPHLINEHTRGNDLLKVLDYMAAGVPVVSTNCSGVDKYGDAVYVAESSADFVSAVDDVLSEKLKLDVENGYVHARKNSWAVKIPELESWLAEVVAVSEEENEN